MDYLLISIARQNKKKEKKTEPADSTYAALLLRCVASYKMILCIFYFTAKGTRLEFVTGRSLERYFIGIMRNSG